ncbi:uncharacterized protein BDZ83DRAFT_649767 [Colletotrichum acutatum]|uniref:Uncharacterized protein n=1 Tax=Glomerella acutata TaxID=27357 RepID=A0AAD8XJQ6_GLOAC|nr:uncharacterized protein BDZ83DRAFT_649767 [Colletotrichum acutatum]KAK1727185.1 hypothetical protein BDZ83DRAFT_649767 [Colletotrichum acutatum]
MDIENILPYLSTLPLFTLRGYPAYGTKYSRKAGGWDVGYPIYTACHRPSTISYGKASIRYLSLYPLTLGTGNDSQGPGLLSPGSLIPSRPSACRSTVLTSHHGAALSVSVRTLRTGAALQAPQLAPPPPASTPSSSLLGDLLFSSSAITEYSKIFLSSASSAGPQLYLTCPLTIPPTTVLSSLSPGTSGRMEDGGPVQCTKHQAPAKQPRGLPN